MGIDSHGLNFLRYAHKASAFGSTVMIGRQGVHLSDRELRAHLDVDPSNIGGPYAEKLLTQVFGASSAESIDFSDYEQATILHDFNRPLPDIHKGKYNTVIDFGTLEHVFNIPQALANCSALCCSGGQILHALPANNLCGHGFWQFSPELFISLYSPKNGYAKTEIFLADLTDLGSWFIVERPLPGHRINVRSRNQIYILVRTVLNEFGQFCHEDVQQSDYITTWGATDEMSDPANRTAVSGAGAIRPKRGLGAIWHKLGRSLNKRRGRLAGTPFLRPVSLELILRG